MADPNNDSFVPNYSLYDESAYFPRTPQSYNAQVKARLGADNLDTRVGKRIYNKQVLGQSSDTSLGDTTFNVNLMEGVVESRKQSGQSGFTSLEERPFALSPTLTTGAPLPDGRTQLEYLDQNPAKLIEQDAGDVNEYVHQQMALSKDSPVYYNIMVPMKGPDQSKITDGRPTKEEKKAAVEGDVTWGFRPPTIEIDTEKLKRIKKAHSIPYARVIEDRVGTASYGYGEGMEGAFSEDVVMIEILQNISGLRISGSRQEFTPVEPRGSQRPMYFYNRNTGRTLEFTATFHQQEYPLEPLYSIAEKAQYLLRPYKHGDYGLIPKTIRVEVPGRVFRCYCTQAEANFSGEDYRGWSELGLNESNIGSMGYGSVYTGIRPRIEEQTGRVYNSSQYINANVDVLTNSLYTSNDYRYGLSEMSISFSFNILEEIKLTTYETQAEVTVREKQEEEEKKKSARYDALLKAQQYIDDAKKNGVEIGYTAEQLVLVNSDGDVVAILINEDGTITPRDPAINAASGEVTIEEYNKQKALENTNATPTNEEKSVIPKMQEQATKEVDRKGMIDYLVKRKMEQYPNRSEEEIRKEVDEQYKDASDSTIYSDYKQLVMNPNDPTSETISILNTKITFHSDAYYKASLLSYSTTLTTSRYEDGTTQIVEKPNMPECLEAILGNPINTPEAIQKFCKDLHVGGTENDWDLNVVFEYALVGKSSGQNSIGGHVKGVTSYSNICELWEVPIWKYYDESIDSDEVQYYQNNFGYHLNENDLETTYFNLQELLSMGKIKDTLYKDINDRYRTLISFPKILMKQILEHPEVLVMPYETWTDTSLAENFKNCFNYYRDMLVKRLQETIENLYVKTRDKVASGVDIQYRSAFEHRKLKMFSSRSNNAATAHKERKDILSKAEDADQTNKIEDKSYGDLVPIFKNFSYIYGCYYIEGSL